MPHCTTDICILTGLLVGVYLVFHNEHRYLLRPEPVICLDRYQHFKDI